MRHATLSKMSTDFTLVYFVNTKNCTLPCSFLCVSFIIFLNLNHETVSYNFRFIQTLQVLNVAWYNAYLSQTELQTECRFQVLKYLPKLLCTIYCYILMSRFDNKFYLHHIGTCLVHIHSFTTCFLFLKVLSNFQYYLSIWLIMVTNSLKRGWFSWIDNQLSVDFLPFNRIEYYLLRDHSSWLEYVVHVTIDLLELEQCSTKSLMLNPGLDTNRFFKILNNIAIKSTNISTIWSPIRIAITLFFRLL